ncbi:MAG: class I SAM-dependent methyltransferase [Deltaproteobacteria bacterium]|nr:class I SAM-dependent methyltransferase [Deltaproteobacteria bacterium]
MPASFTRRRDLLADAGFADADAALAALAAEVEGLGLRELPRPHDLSRLRAHLAARLGRVPADQLRLARLLPAWLAERGGDLATALWLAREEHGAALDLPGFALAAWDALAAAGRDAEVAALGRFLFDLHAGWEELWGSPEVGHRFLRAREPNPLVWRLLEELAPRGAALQVLELGCGIGNDAVGFLDAPSVDRYLGVDLSQEALDAFAARVAREPTRVRPELRRADFLGLLRGGAAGLGSPNLVYSYSSLHYFSSAELAEIHRLVRELLRPRGPAGYFAFGIKGQGSIWDGQGLPLYRPDVWVNGDGQSRWFPSREALGRQLDRAGFEVRFHELHDHWGYSELGKRDVFHYVLCSPRT